MGDKYLEDMDYDKALAAYTEALAIDDRSPEAYLGLVEVYIRTSDFDMALDIAEQGYEKTGDERLKEKMDMIESGSIYDSMGRIYKMTFRDGDGTITGYHEYTYEKGDKGKMSTVTHLNASGVAEQFIDLEYDEEGYDIVSYRYHVDDGGLSKVENTIIDGLVVHSIATYLGSDYSYSDETDYYYENGLSVKEVSTHYSDNSEPYVDVTFNEYDSEGRLIKRSFADEDEVVHSYYTNSYDENGNTIEEISYSQSYGEDGTQSGEFKLSSRRVFSYNSDGECTGIKEYDADGNLTGSIDYN